MNSPLEAPLAAASAVYRPSFLCLERSEVQLWNISQHRRCLSSFSKFFGAAVLSDGKPGARPIGARFWAPDSNMFGMKFLCDASQQRLFGACQSRRWIALAFSFSLSSAQERGRWGSNGWERAWPFKNQADWRFFPLLELISLIVWSLICNVYVIIV